jgi:uncharacterized metal-binding protein YceD (DUF177 family)
MIHPRKAKHHKDLHRNGTQGRRSLAHAATNEVILPMKLLTKGLRGPKTLTLQGDESWLSEIYSSFPANERPLSGQIEVIPEAYGLYAVKGHVDYTPSVECARCSELIGYPIHRDISVRFIDRDQAESGLDIEGIDEDEVIERELDSKDLDTYYIESTGEIDLEMVINDFVQTALPTRVTCANVNKICGVDLKDSQSGLVHKDKNDFESSPFAALKSLKLPDA